jgi:hypothetical protein
MSEKESLEAVSLMEIIQNNKDKEPKKPWLITTIW